MHADIARLKRADRITALAEKELNLITPEPESLVVFIDADVFTKQRGGEE